MEMTAHDLSPEPEEEVAVSTCPVNSYTEWDPLEEVIVGRLEHATIPSYHLTVSFNIPRSTARLYRFAGGLRYPKMLTGPAQRELDEFIHILEAEGVTVRRPDVIDFSKKTRSPYWKSTGWTSACPRDSVLIVGDEIIETPMAWPSRYFETHAFRSLFKEYFRQGARWTSAPKPQLTEELFEDDYVTPGPDEPLRYIINEHEPVFDAADFVRCGRDIFVTRGNVTNQFGVDWLQRHLGDDYRIHDVESRCRQPMHIDSSFMPLAPGKVLVNPEYIDVKKLPPALKSWDVLVAPDPDPVHGYVRSMSAVSAWISVNMLMLDEKRVIAEKSQPSMLKALRDWGFEVIECSFLHYGPFGGSFHCATLDVRRRGTLQSYL